MSEQFFASGCDGTRLFVRVRPSIEPEGSGVTALLCDGIACDGFIWKYLWDLLPYQVRVAHWHYRGHGRSAAPADPDRIEIVDHARDCDLVRREIGDGEVVLFGHSMGCQVALEAYHLRPEKVRGLVLLCGASGRITHTFKGSNVLAQVLPKIVARVTAHPELARAIWSRMPQTAALRIALATGEIDGARIVPEDVMPYMRHAADIDLPMFVRMLQSAGDHSAEPYLGDIAAPVLVVGGERDTFTPPKLAEAMARAMPKGEYLHVANATHVAPIEQPELVGARIAQFLHESCGVPLPPPDSSAPLSRRPSRASIH